MINIFLFLVFLVNGIQSTPQQEFGVELEGIVSGNINYAGVILQTYNGTKLYGVGGTVSVYNPKVEKDQLSSAVVWIRNGPGQNSNIILAGWHVLPQLYNDDKTHLFIFWTKDSFKKTGCYNLHCPGFIQTDKTITLGQSLETSISSGITNELTFSILQDPNTKDWGVNINEKNIGYFPASLFSNMSSVDQVAWIGITSNPLGTPSPPMGSGVFPDGGWNRASYFKNLEFIDDSGKDQPLGEDIAPIFTSKPECYGAHYFDGKGKVPLSLQFGGPGGKCGI